MLERPGEGDRRVPTPRDLLNEAKKQIREVDPADGGGAGGRSRHLPRRSRARRVRAGRHARRRPRAPRHWSPRSREATRQDPRSSSTAPAAPAPPWRRGPWATSATPTWQSMIGGFNRWKDQGLPSRAPQPYRPSATATSATSSSPRSARRPAEASRLQGAAAGRRRPRLAGGALPGRGGGRHHRHHRHGRRRRVQPAAADPPQHGPGRRPQGRLGQEDARRR